MEFKRYSFKDLLENIVDNRGKTCPVESDGMPLIATNCIKDNSLYAEYERLRFVSDKTYESWFRGHPEPEDIIFVCKGSPGRVAWVQDPVPYCIAQDMLAIRANKSVINSKFLFALLRNPKTQKSILNMHVGTMIPHFKKGDFSNLHFDIPMDLEYQKRAGELYFNFCEKIELNKETNQTLEQMAQSLFKSWFIDFDPVIDNALAAGNEIPEALQHRAEQRKKDQKLAEYKILHEDVQLLFPSEFEYTEKLGWVPKGWKVSVFPEGSEFREGPGILAKDFHDQGVPLIRLAGLKNGVSLLDGCNFLDPEKVNKKWSHFLLQEGDILLSSSASLGRVAEVDINAVGSVAYTGIISFRPIDGVTNRRFLRHFLQSPIFQKQVTMMGVGSVLNHFGPTHIKKMLMLIPCNTVQEKFSEIITTSDHLLGENLSQSSMLSNIRDTLLPKMISGELQIPDVKATDEKTA
jgi:type I restriction enzyme S subunit